jgi:hypothetical protein
MTLTATQQRNAVSEGIAFGMALLGRTEIPFDKTRVDLAVTGAWQAWPLSGRFPQVSTDLQKGLDGVNALARAGEGQHTWLFWWDRSGRTLKIVTRQAWDPSNQEDLNYAVSVIDDEVPLEAWRSLAAAILEETES